MLGCDLSERPPHFHLSFPSESINYDQLGPESAGPIIHAPYLLQLGNKLGVSQKGAACTMVR